MSPQIEDLISHPTRFFSSPREVLQDQKLTQTDKRKILESWKLDASRLAESTAENMSGGEEGDLREVSKALLELKQVEVPVDALRQGTTLPSGLIIGGLLGAGAGLVAVAATGPSLMLVAQTTIVGLIVGGVMAAVRDAAVRM